MREVLIENVRAASGVMAIAVTILHRACQWSKRWTIREFTLAWTVPLHRGTKPKISESILITFDLRSISFGCRFTRGSSVAYFWTPRAITKIETVASGCTLADLFAACLSGVTCLGLNAVNKS